MRTRTVLAYILAGWPIFGCSMGAVCGCPESLPTWSGTQAGLAAVQADGSALVVFHANPTGQPASGTYTLERLTLSLAMDTGFGDHGLVELGGSPVEMHLSPTGTIVILLDDPAGHLVLASFDPTGSPLASVDVTALVGPSFSLGTGHIFPPYELFPYDAFFSSRVTTMAVQNDGKVLLAPQGASLVVRIGTDGQLDGSFANGGKLDLGHNAFAEDLASLPNGDFVVVSQSEQGCTPAWFDSTGTPVSTGTIVSPNSYAGMLGRSDGAVLVGQGSGDTVAYRLYTGPGTLGATAAFVASLSEHRFIGGDDALDAAPLTGATVSVTGTLPDGSTEGPIEAMLAVADGVSITFANVIPGFGGSTLFLGQHCTQSSNGPDSPLLSCRPLVVSLSASGHLLQMP
jgi:hypothetical protein